MITYQQYSDALTIVKQYKHQIIKEASQVESDHVLIKISSQSKFKDVKQDTRLHDCNCSVRLFNAIRSVLYYNVVVGDWDNVKVQKLSEISLQHFSLITNVGKKTIKELQELCACAKIKLQP